MKKREISAIDSIYEILERIKKIEEHYNLLNKQNALINNKLNKLLEASNSKVELKPSTKPKVSSVSVKTQDKAERSSPENEPSGLVLGNIKVFSKMLSPKRVPISDVNIRIFDIKNSMVRNMLTDSKGYWEARLPAGKYRITMDHDNFKTIEKIITLEKSMKKFEVT